MQETEEIWQQIAWDGVAFQVPRSWEPTAIHTSYLLFEREGWPVFAIKWERIRGRFSPERILRRLQDSLREANANLHPWIPHLDPSEMSQDFAMTGFQYRKGDETCLGLLLYCSHCRRASMLQLYGQERLKDSILPRILQSYTDHHAGTQQLWTVYDIKAQLPAEARLTAHEFLVGRYRLSFVLDKTYIDLYRFKPARAILRTQSLQELGASLAGDAIRIAGEDESIAVWEYRASGLDRLAVISGRKPGWIRLQLELFADANAILAVRGSGRGTMNRALLQQIAADFSVAAENI